MHLLEYVGPYTQKLYEQRVDVLAVQILTIDVTLRTSEPA